MSKIKDLTQNEFNNCPIGQLFIESCCSGTTFTKARKVSNTEIEKMDIDSYNFSANCKIKVFDEKHDWLEPVSEFKDARGKVNTFEELKKIFEC